MATIMRPEAQTNELHPATATGSSPQPLGLSLSTFVHIHCASSPVDASGRPPGASYSIGSIHNVVNIGPAASAHTTSLSIARFRAIIRAS